MYGALVCGLMFVDCFSVNSISARSPLFFRSAASRAFSATFVSSRLIVSSSVLMRYQPVDVSCSTLVIRASTVGIHASSVAVQQVAGCGAEGVGELADVLSWVGHGGAALPVDVRATRHAGELCGLRLRQPLLLSEPPHTLREVPVVARFG